MPLSPIQLPITTIDPTFLSVLQDVDAGLVPSDKFWVSCYKAGERSVHGKIQAELDEVQRDVVRLKTVDAAEDTRMELGVDGVYRVSCPPLAIEPTPVLSPVQEYLDPERSNPRLPQRITAFDVSPDSTRFATGFLDGSVFLYPISASSSSQPPKSLTSPPSSRVVARPHLSTTTHLQFFPSSRVLLSAGADFSLSILPADLPEPSSLPLTSSAHVTPVRTLRAHTRPVTATLIPGVGRNVLSASLDGTLKLWDVPSAAVILSIPAPRAQPILSIVFGPPVEHGDPAPADADPPSYHHTVYGGLQNGSIAAFDLRTRSSRVVVPPSPHGGASALAYNGQHHLLAAGSSRGGLVRVFDTRRLEGGETPEVTSFARRAFSSNADTSSSSEPGAPGVESLAFLAGDESGLRLSLVVATTDGLPYVADILPDGPGVHAELVGGECDAVRVVRARGVAGTGHEEGGRGQRGWDVWSAGDDAVVRRWRV